jgi:hypothetical protein
VLRVHRLLTLADRYHENQQFDDWQRTLDRAFVLLRRRLALLLMGRAHNGLGEPELGATAAERALGIATERLGDLPSSYDTGRARLELGIAKPALRDLPAARQELERAAGDLRACIGATAPETRRAAAALAQVGEPDVPAAPTGMAARAAARPPGR